MSDAATASVERPLVHRQEAPNPRRVYTDLRLGYREAMVEHLHLVIWEAHMAIQYIEQDRDAGRITHSQGLKACVQAYLMTQNEFVQLTEKAPD